MKWIDYCGCEASEGSPGFDPNEPNYYGPMTRRHAIQHFVTPTGGIFALGAKDSNNPGWDADGRPVE